MEDEADQSGSAVVVGVSETEIRLSRSSSPSSQNAVTEFANGLVGYEGLQVINSDGGTDDVHEWKLEVSHHPPMSAAHGGNEHFIYDITSKSLRVALLGACYSSAVLSVFTTVRLILLGRQLKSSKDKYVTSELESDIVVKVGEVQFYLHMSSENGSMDYTRPLVFGVQLVH